MFIIKNNLNNEEHLWANKHEDDFLQFVPDALGVSKDDISIYKCSCSVSLDKESIYRETVDIANLKHIFEKKTAGFMAGEMEGETLHEVDTIDLAFEAPLEDSIMLIAYPYDEAGNFLGNN